MTNRELIILLLNEPLDDQIWIGKGMGPLEEVKLTKTYIVQCIMLSPARR